LPLTRYLPGFASIYIGEKQETGTIVQTFEGGAVRERERHLTELYEVHALRALRLAYILTGVREVAEDLVQEAFLRSFDHLETLREQEAFPGYLRQTILNLARAHFRRKKLEGLSLRRLALLTGSVRGDPPDVEQRESLWRALQQLPYRQRAAVVLRYYEDLTESQAAEVMGTSVPALKALVSRGTSKLRAELDHEGGGD
jgi:RNA polymerase sigma-70 factor (sigma-E family)